MSEFIEQDEELKRKYDLLTSIKGVGKVRAVSLLIYTNDLAKLQEARKLACYCRVAPFEYKRSTGKFLPYILSVKERRLLSCFWAQQINWYQYLLPKPTRRKWRQPVRIIAV